MWRRLNLFLVGIAFIFANHTTTSHAAEMSLVTVADCWIHGLNSSSPSGGSDARVAVCPVASYWMYFKLDLSGVEGTITDAEFRLTRFAGARPNEISLYLIDDDTWTEAALAGTNRPAPESPDPGDTLAEGEELGDYDRWKSTSFTNAVVAEAAGDGLLSIMVREQTLR